MNPDDYDEDGNNIVPCPICLNVYCASKEEGGKCPEEDEFAHSMTTNPQDNFIQEAVERFNVKFDVSNKEDDFEKVFYDHIRNFLKETLEAQKSHIKETLLAGMAVEKKENTSNDTPTTAWNNETYRNTGYNTARKEDRALINNI